MRAKVLGESAVQRATAPRSFELRRPTMPFAIASLLCFCNALPGVWNWYAFWGGREPVTDVLELVNLKTGMAGVETAQATQHQTNPIAPRWTFRVRTH